MLVGLSKSWLKNGCAKNTKNFQKPCQLSAHSHRAHPLLVLPTTTSLIPDAYFDGSTQQIRPSVQNSLCFKQRTACYGPTGARVHGDERTDPRRERVQHVADTWLREPYIRASGEVRASALSASMSSRVEPAPSAPSAHIAGAGQDSLEGVQITVRPTPHPALSDIKIDADIGDCEHVDAVRAPDRDP